MTKDATDQGFDDYLAAYEKEREARKEAISTHKAAIFDALAESGFALVTVTFDGVGDSGQIEDITAFVHTDHRPIPERLVHTDQRPIPNRIVRYLKDDISLTKAIEHLCYELLELEYPGWENNDGAFGEFTVAVPGRGIRLDFNERFTDFTHHTHGY